MGNFGSKSTTKMPSRKKGRRSGSGGRFSGRKGHGKKSGEKVRTIDASVVSNVSSDKHIPRTKDPEQQALDELRTCLHKDLNTFILDNLLLSVQFFQNFEREVNTLRSTPYTEPEANRNRQLKEQGRHCLTPDRLHQLVARRVQYRPQHGDNKHVMETLQPQRLVVVQDNVELVEGRDSGHYGDDKTGVQYTLCMETASPGYAKLFTTKQPNQRRVTYESIDNKSDSSYDSPKVNDDEGISLCEENKPNPGSSNSVPSLVEPDGNPSSANIKMPPAVPFNRPPQPLPDAAFIQQLHSRVEHGSFSSSASIDGDIDTASDIETPKARQQRHIFGPQSPEREDLKKPLTVYTKTERKLSGIRRHRAQRPLIPPRIPLSTSLPNLTSISGTSRTSPANSESSGYKSGSSLNLNNSQPNSRGSESEYSYGVITYLRTPKPIRLRRLGRNPVTSTEIPVECFKIQEIPIHEDQFQAASDDSDEESDQTLTNSTTRTRSKSKLFTTRYYLNSTNYMASFADIFIERLFEPLGFKEESTHNPMMQGATIHCDIVQQREAALTCKTTMNIIPSIASRSWPNEAFEWIIRPRNLVRSGNVMYQWPTQKMVDRIQGYGHNILPVGYLPTRGKNNEHQLEWQLAFPRAEQYLESCLTHAQLRCYLFTLALYKTFLEPAQNSEIGLNPTHIRTMLFWQCERNYANWPENKPGVTLSKFLARIYDTLKKEKLTDYFLPQRNLYESMPRSHLRKAQEQLHKIRENLTIHMLVAVRNLRYVEGEGNFYPVLDYKKLYQILTTDDFVSILNPSLGLAMKITKEKEKKVKKEEIESDDSDRDDLWKSVTKNDPNREWNKQVRRQIEAEKAAQQLASGPRISTDSINPRMFPSLKHNTMRNKLLLELFISHFVSVARRSIHHMAYHQCLMYLTQAERLCILLQEEPGSDQNVIDGYMFDIRIYRDRALGFLNPKSPSEESEEFVFVKKSMMRLPSAVEKTSENRKNSEKDTNKVVPVVTIAEVHSSTVTETNDENLQSGVSLANLSDDEDGAEETSL